MKKQNKYKLNLKPILVSFFLGIAVGIICHKQWLFYLPQISYMKRVLSARAASLPKAHQMSDWVCSIEARYLPVYRVREGSKGKKDIVMKEGRITLTVPASEIALVLLDTWDEPQNDMPLSPLLRSQKAILEKCREHGVKIIHAPGHPAVDRYPQYLALKTEVEGLMKKYGAYPNQPLPPFLDWPGFYNNEVWQRAEMLRAKGRLPQYKLRPRTEIGISRHLKPLGDEYVLSSYLEFRYVLWKNKIKLLLYIGGSLNECMLQRDTGINLLAGSDSRRIPITVVVLGDCSSAMGSPGLDSEAARKAMLEYYKFKIAFVADSKNICFARLRKAHR